MKNNKGIAHLFLLVIVFVVAIGAVGYLAYKNNQIKLTPKDGFVGKPTPASIYKSTNQYSPKLKEFPVFESENWKVYRNDDYNFQFRYPADYESVGQESKSEGTLHITFNHINYNTKSEDYGTDKYEPRKIELSLTKSSFSLREYLQDRLNMKMFKFGSFEIGELGDSNKDVNWAEAVVEIYEEKINSNNFIVVHLAGAGGGDRHFHTKFENNTIAMLDYGVSSTYYGEELLNQILSTFKFTE